jgi:ribosomal protein S11
VIYDEIKAIEPSALKKTNKTQNPEMMIDAVVYVHASKDNPNENLLDVIGDTTIAAKSGRYANIQNTFTTFN